MITFVIIKLYCMQDIIKLDSIDQYNQLYGLETLHPQIAVVDLSKATRVPTHFTINYGVYALFLKQTKCGDLRYGKQPYDYQEGTVTSFAPGQIVEVVMAEPTPPKSVGLLFHPDFIRGGSLGKEIKRYSFFSYASNEALHLSDEEKGIFQDCLAKIKSELGRPIDKHSKHLICKNIELLLDYCMRFYDRQFDIRSFVYRDILGKFEEQLDAYYQGNQPQISGLPTVKYFADKFHLSPNYFGDLIKKETGRTAQEYIQNKILSVAKEEIMRLDLTISEISYRLGFQQPQHLTRLFKKSVGCTPKEFRSY